MNNDICDTAATVDSAVPQDHRAHLLAARSTPPDQPPENHCRPLLLECLFEASNTAEGQQTSAAPGRLNRPNQYRPVDATLIGLAAKATREAPAPHLRVQLLRPAASGESAGRIQSAQRGLTAAGIEARDKAAHALGGHPARERVPDAGAGPPEQRQAAAQHGGDLLGPPAHPAADQQARALAPPPPPNAEPPLQPPAGRAAAGRNHLARKLGSSIGRTGADLQSELLKPQQQGLSEKEIKEPAD